MGEHFRVSIIPYVAGAIDQRIGLQNRISGFESPTTRQFFESSRSDVAFFIPRRRCGKAGNPPRQAGNPGSHTPERAVFEKGKTDDIHPDRFWSNVDLTGNQTSEEWTLSVLAEMQKQYEERYDGRDESTLY